MAFLLPAKSRLLLLSALLLLLCPSPPPVLLRCLSPPSPPHRRAAPPEQSGGERSPQCLESPRPRQCVWGGCWPQWGKAGCHHCDVGLSHCDLRLSQRGCTHPPRPALPGGLCRGQGLQGPAPTSRSPDQQGFPQAGAHPCHVPTWGHQAGSAYGLPSTLPRFFLPLLPKVSAAGSGGLP